MAKYDPLRDYLKTVKTAEIVLTYPEVEKLVGPLPASAERPQFWANTVEETQRHPPVRAAHDAGFESFLIKSTVNRVRVVRKRR